MGYSFQGDRMIKDPSWAFEKGRNRTIRDWIYSKTNPASISYEGPDKEDFRIRWSIIPWLQMLGYSDVLDPVLIEYGYEKEICVSEKVKKKKVKEYPPKKAR